MVHRAFSETRLREDLRALRHLPPSARLPHPAAQEERRLLADLLHLTDAEDPLRWLSAERGPLAAQLTLQDALQQLQGRAIGLRRWSAWRGRPIPEAERLLLGDLVRLPQDAEIFTQLNQEATASPELLREVLRQLHILRGGASGRQPAGPADDEQQQLLWDLLSLSSQVDPLRWLHAERRALVARVALTRILEQCRPARTLEVGPSTRIRRPKGALSSPRELRMAFEELVFGMHGFTFSANIRLAIRNVARPPQVDRIILSWPGFDRVIDDLGNHYLLQHYNLGVHSQLWWLRERLQMAFYPAVVARATTLMFTSSPVVLQVIGSSRSANRSLPLPDRYVGDLSWRVTVPRDTSSLSTAA